MPQTKTRTTEKSVLVKDPRGSLKATEALGSFEHAIGGRNRLIAALELANLTEDQNALILALSDPARKEQKLATVCGDLGLRPGEVLDLFRSASFAKAHAVTMGIVSEALPGVTKDVVEKAVDSTIPCPVCRTDPDTEPGDPECHRCKGKGLIRRLADFERQKMVFETAGLLKKGGGGTATATVNVQQNAIGGAPAASFAKLIKALDGPARDIGPPDVIDVTPDGETDV